MNAELMSELLGGAGRYKALRCLFEHPDKGYGPRELAAETGVDAGNLSRWLRRWADIGLLLVTDASRLQAQAHFKAAGRALGRPVNVLTFTADQWAEAKRSRDEFVAEVLRNPVITLQGELNAAQG